MMINVFISILFIYFTCAESKGSLLLTNSMGKTHIEHSINQPFINYVVFDENEIVTKCEFEYEFSNGTQNHLLMDVHSTNIVFDDFYFKDRVSNIGRGLCGVKFSKLTRGDPKFYRLLVTTKDNTNATKYYFQIGIYDVGFTADKTYIARLGETVILSCDEKGQNSCTLYNPLGDIVMESTVCSHTINYVTMREIGAWRCIYGNHSMEGFEVILNVKLKENLKIESWYKEEDGYGTIGCKIINDGTLPVIEACEIISPTNQVYAVKESLIANRYTSIGTDLKKYICQLEFPLPVLSSEIGIWKCRVDQYGAFIKLKTNTLPEYKNPKKKILQVGKELKIICEVPYSTDNCIIKSPNGIIYYPDSLPLLTQGICSKKFKKSSISDIGKWTCYISHPENSQDDQLTIEVQSITSIVSIANEIEITAGESAEIMVKSAAPISSCRFIDPSGKSYHLDPAKLDTDIKYSGRGLIFGECGISIATVRKEQEGEWSCHISQSKTGSQTTPELKAKTNIIIYGGISDISLGYSAGIPIGVGGAMLILFGFVVHRLYKKRSAISSQTRSSSPGGENMYILQQPTTNTGTFEDTTTTL